MKTLALCLILCVAAAVAANSCTRTVTKVVPKVTTIETACQLKIVYLTEEEALMLSDEAFKAILHNNRYIDKRCSGG